MAVGAALACLACAPAAGAGGGLGAAASFPAGGNHPYVLATGNSLAVADFDQDGQPDVAMVNPSQGSAGVLLGGPGGGLGPPATFAAGPFPLGVAAGDFNQDGDPDLAVVNAGGANTLTVLVGQPGGGGFSVTPQVTTGGALPWLVAAGHLNGDGDPDLVIANSGSDEVSVLLGQPGAGFRLEGSHAAGDSPASVAIEDFDQDGHADVAVANSSSDSVSVLTGDGDGDFAPRDVHSTAGSSPRSVATGDLDRDGDPDLAIANYHSSSVSVLRGQAGADFAFDGAHAIPGPPSELALADLNGDGDLDLTVAVASFPGVAAVLVGTAGAAFEQHSSTGTGGDLPAGLAIADFDGDGHRDLAVANEYSHTVSVLLAVPDLSPSPASVDFGASAPGAGSTSRTVSGRNSGFAPLTVASARIGGLDAGDFVVDADACSGRTLPPGGTCDVELRFRPAAEGVRDAALELTSDSRDSPHTIPLTGTGETPPQAPAQPAVTPPAAIEPPRQPAEARPPAEPQHAEAIVVSRARLRLSRSGNPLLDTGLAIRCPAGLPRNCGGSGRVTATVDSSLAAGRRRYVVGKLGFAARSGHTRSIAIRLTNRGLRILRRTRRLRLTLRLVTRGARGARVVTPRTVVLRLPRG